MFRLTLPRLILRQSPIASFLVLTYGLSALIWLGSAVLSVGDPTVVGVAGLVGSFGPAMAAIAVVRAEHPAAVPAWRQHGWPAIALVGAAAVVMLRQVLAAGADFSLLLLGTVGVALVGWVTLHGSSGGFFPTLLDIHFGWRWWLAALFTFPLVVVMGMVLAWWFDGSLPSFPSQRTGFAVMATLPFSLLTTLFFGGPLGEEPGWRGFLQPRLQARFSPLVATLMVGVLWSLWHAPLHLNGFYPGGVVGLFGRLFFNVPMAFLLAWICKHTGGSVLAAVLTHLSLNLTTGYLPIANWVYLPGLALVFGIIVVDQMWVHSHTVRVYV